MSILKKTALASIQDDGTGWRCVLPHEAGTDAAHRILDALVVAVTDERLGGDPGKCCGAVTVLVGGAIDGRVAVRQ